jgi:hypothetical protein
MKEKFINASLLIGSIIFSLVILEVSLRVYKGHFQFVDFRGEYINLFKSELSYVYDAELGWVPASGGAGKQERIAGTTVMILDDGVRSNGDAEGSDLTDAILAVGDSYTFGSKVADWETWPAQLEKLSGRRVINGGVPGYGIDQAFLRARRLLDQYRVRTLIFSFIPDDINRSQMSERFSVGKPYFDLKNGRLTLENVPVPPPRPLPQKENKLLFVLGHSYLAHLLMMGWSPEWWLAGRGYVDTQVHDDQKGAKVCCALLHELEELTKARGVELVVLVQHDAKVVSCDVHRVTERRCTWSTLVETVLSCLSDPATRVLDLKSVLSELKANDPSRYGRLYLSEGHMTAEGNHLVALEVSKFLTQQ